MGGDLDHLISIQGGVSEKTPLNIGGHPKSPSFQDNHPDVLQFLELALHHVVENPLDGIQGERNKLTCPETLNL